MQRNETDVLETEMNFEPTWESLKQYNCPDWFRDAKFGIWAHWGPQAVPMVGDWYARQMYMQGHRHYEHHVKLYGHPSEFGFKDILPLWKAEHFDPAGIIDLYKKAGARYFTACAVHHDNFDCWDSKYNKWNSVNIGPKKDIVGMWAKAARDAGLRFGITEHHERSYSWFNTNKGSDADGSLKGVPYDGANPEYEDYYYESHTDTSHEYPKNPSIAFIENWYDRIDDFIEKYQPDLIYTDGGIPFGQYGRRMLANYYNQSLGWSGGNLDVVYNYKDGGLYPEAEEEGADHNLYGDFVEGIGVVDIERGVVEGIHPDPWQTDTCIGKWYYDKDVTYKTSTEVIQMLADIVSKNGNLLLNIPLMPDGLLDETEMQVVHEIGEWMQVNGEAIFGTRPWIQFGEGPVRAQSGHMREKQKIIYTAEDFRFTTKEETIYAIGLQKPVEGQPVVIRSVAQNKIRDVEILGCSKPLSWHQDEVGLHIEASLSDLPGSCFTVKIGL